MKTDPLFRYSSFPTPAGRFSVAVDSSGAVAAAVFGGRKALAARLKSGRLVADARRTGAARGEIRAWFRRGRRAFSMPIAPKGSVFQRRVWNALCAIPYGQTRSYGDLAKALRSSPRAVGRANATNPICVLVPCHRVIGADGSLTGYAFGERTKRRLLDLEKA